MEQNNAELRALNATTQRLAQEYKELIDMQVDNDPTLFKLEDSIRDGADEEKEHEQEKDSGLER